MGKEIRPTNNDLTTNSPRSSFPIETVDTSLPIKAKSAGVINAVRISARAHLTEGVILGATNSLNGDKILAVEEARITEGQVIQARVGYQMSGGLASFQINFSEESSCRAAMP